MSGAKRLAIARMRLERRHRFRMHQAEIERGLERHRRRAQRERAMEVGQRAAQVARRCAVTRGRGRRWSATGRRARRQRAFGLGAGEQESRLRFDRGDRRRRDAGGRQHVGGRDVRRAPRIARNATNAAAIAASATTTSGDRPDDCRDRDHEDGDEDDQPEVRQQPPLPSRTCAGICTLDRRATRCGYGRRCRDVPSFKPPMRASGVLPRAPRHEAPRQRAARPQVLAQCRRQRRARQAARVHHRAQGQRAPHDARERRCGERRDLGLGSRAASSHRPRPRPCLRAVRGESRGSPRTTSPICSQARRM